jgi:hypothetical protein
VRNSVYTVATDIANGSTEFWLGSHRNTSWADHLQDGTNFDSSKKDTCPCNRSAYRLHRSQDRSITSGASWLRLDERSAPLCSHPFPKALWSFETRDSGMPAYVWLSSPVQEAV